MCCLLHIPLSAGTGRDCICGTIQQAVIMEIVSMRIFAKITKTFLTQPIQPSVYVGNNRESASLK